MSELDRILRMIQGAMAGQRGGLGSITDLEMRELVGSGRMTENEMMSNPSGLGSMTEMELAQMMQPRSYGIGNLSDVEARVLSDTNSLINSGLLGFTGNQANEVVNGLLEQKYINDMLNSYDVMANTPTERQLEMQRLLDEERMFGRIR